MRIGSNIFSSLNRTTRALQTSLEHLSSGKRINSAKDDIAGLSVTTRLESQIRGMIQAIRNVNDGMSLLQVAEGALSGMTDILQAMREFAIQAASGTLSNDQRSSLNTQISTLIDEFERITTQTEFNSIHLLDGSSGTRSFQIGTGNNSQLSFSLDNFQSQQVFQKTVGTGTFEPQVTYSAGSAPTSISTADVNLDGIPDLISGGDALGIHLGRADGSFASMIPFPGSVSSPPSIDDLNADGIPDIVCTAGANNVAVYIGNGDGTFHSRVTYLAESTIELSDINHDGAPDIIAADADNWILYVLLNNGDGTFNARTSIPYEGTEIHCIDATDLNQDGHIDLLLSLPDKFGVMFGNGDATFSLPQLYTTPQYVTKPILADLNNDGRVDIFATSINEDTYAHVWLGNGDGSFRSYTQFDSPQLCYTSVGDVNGDGCLDVVGKTSAESGSNTIYVLLGNGDGSFRAAEAGPEVGTGYGSLALGDFNFDGALDIATCNAGDNTMSILGGNSVNVTAISELMITQQADASTAISIIDHALERLLSGRSNIGNLQSRLDHTTNNLYSMRDQLTYAHADIMNADIANETAELVRNQILQQAGISMLAHANLIQSNILSLLNY